MKTAAAKLTFFYLCLITISLMLAFQSVAKVDPKSAAAVWLFDEGSGNVAKDYTGNGNDGNLINNPKWVDGKFGKALEFNGTNSYVDVSAPNGLPKGSAARTVSLWFKWSEIKWPSPGVEIMGYGPNSNSTRLGMWIGSSPHCLGIETCNFGVVFPWDGDTNWHHLVAAYPKGETGADKFKIYFDGVLQKSEASGAIQNLNTGDSPLTIGVLPQAKVYYFNGIVDDVAIFGEELSEGDIKGIMKGGLLKASAVSPSGKLATAWGKIKPQ